MVCRFNIVRIVLTLQPKIKGKMNINDHVYFAPNILLKDLDLSNKDSLISAFEKRINEYYLKAIELLNNKKSAYATGIIEFSMIDALAKYSTKKNSNVKERIIKILCDNFKLNTELAERAYDEFRNGLLHENHIKNSGQFCYETTKAFDEQKGCLIVNPKHLENELKQVFRLFIKKLKTDDKVYNLFLSHIKEDFEQEIIHFQNN